MSLKALMIAVAMAASGAGAAQALDTENYYRLSTEFRGTAMNLDIFNGGPKNNMTHLAPEGDFSGQYWRLTDAGNGFYRLTTMFRGKNLCLDVVNGGPRNNQTQLTDCGNYSGQFWNIRSDRGFFRMTTQFRGRGECLDIFNGGPDNNQAHLAPCGNYSGQFWRLSATNKPVVTGQSVTVARFDGGRWQNQGGNRWVELGDDGSRFYFVETRRENDAIILDDQSRNLQVKIDVRRRMSYWTQNHGNFTQLYPLTELSD